MREITPDVDLRAAREASVVRFLAIAEALKAEAGVQKHTVRKSLSGYAWPKKHEIVAPEGRTRKQLYILAHECAHVILGHIYGKKPRHLEEVEAEEWAHAALRRHGVPVPRSMTLRSKWHIQNKIHQALRSGAKEIAPRAKAYIRGKRKLVSRGAMPNNTNL